MLAGLSLCVHRVRVRWCVRPKSVCLPAASSTLASSRAVCGGTACLLAGKVPRAGILHSFAMLEAAGVRCGVENEASERPRATVRVRQSRRTCSAGRCVCVCCAVHPAAPARETCPLTIVPGVGARCPSPVYSLKSVVSGQRIWSALGAMLPSAYVPQLIDRTFELPNLRSLLSELLQRLLQSFSQGSCFVSLRIPEKVLDRRPAEDVRKDDELQQPADQDGERGVEHEGPVSVWRRLQQG